MGMYMYPISIDYTKKEIRTKRKVKINDIDAISLDLIQKNVNKEETFYVDFENYCLIVEGKRLETDEEQSKRVEKELSYMQKYNAYHFQKK